MPALFAHSAADGSYHLDVAIGNRRFHLLIDTGFVDSLDEVGIALEAPIYDVLTRSGILQYPKLRVSFDASGTQYWLDTGSTVAQLVDSVTGGLVGPLVRIRVSRGQPSVPSRVGIAFFHRLAGCRVVWELDQCSWCIEYP